jgi:acyl-CoA thioesterase FadM
MFVETYRATVAPADCDHLGHMNVQHHFAAVSDGMFAIMSHRGLGPDEIRRRQMSFAVVRAETDFHRELRAGDLVVLESTVVKVADKSATFRQRCDGKTANERGVQVRASRSREASCDDHPRRHPGGGRPANGEGIATAACG